MTVMRGMQTYADCCVEAFIFIRCTEQVQVDYKDKDKKRHLKHTHKTYTKTTRKFTRKTSKIFVQAFDHILFE